MALVVNCPCGEVIKAETEDELVRLVQEHAKNVHNQTTTREEALAVARRE
jgi:predicted small metal-binding protein